MTQIRGLVVYKTFHPHSWASIMRSRVQLSDTPVHQLSVAAILSHNSTLWLIADSSSVWKENRTCCMFSPRWENCQKSVQAVFCFIIELIDFFKVYFWPFCRERENDMQQGATGFNIQTWVSCSKDCSLWKRGACSTRWAIMVPMNRSTLI